MAVDRQAWYVLNFPWVEDSVELGSTGEIHSFGDWVNELLTTADALDAVMTYFDGSTPERPQWFSLTPSPGIVTAWGPVGNIRTGWVQPMADDYPASFITNDSSVPGPYVDDALDYLLANLGGGSWIDSVDELASAPPVAPPTNYRVMVNSNTPTGLFTGHPWEIAITSDGGLSWSFVATGVADAVISKTDPDIIYIHDGSQFQSFPLNTATTFLALTDTPSTYVGQALKTVRVNAGETALEFVTDDYTVKASAADTTPDHLMDKLDAGSGVSLSIINPGANEKVRIDVPSAGTGASITSVSLHRNTSSGVVVPNDASWIDVPFPSALITTGLVTKDGTNKIFTINQDGVWFLEGRVTMKPDVGQVRSQVRIVVDTGGGYTELGASDGFAYTPNDFLDESTVTTGVVPFVASATDKFKVQFRTDGGSIAGELATMGTSVLCYKIEASGGVSTLAGLTDVDIPTPANGEVLTYNSGTSKWEAVAFAGGGDMLGSNNLSDVANTNTSLNNLLPAQAGNAGEFLTTNGTNTAWAPITGTGDLVGPASSVDGHIPQFDGTTGKLLKDGIATSTGGNDTADSGKVVIFNSEGQVRGSVLNSSTAAIWGDSHGSGYGGLFTGGAGTTKLATPVAAVEAASTSLVIDATRITSGTVLHVGALSGTGLDIDDTGKLAWTNPAGAQGTATNLPAFGALTKGVVPAAGAVPSASKFLTETGTFAVPAGTGVPTSRTISTTAPLAGGGDMSADRTLSIADALADGATKGAAAFDANDFNSTSGIIRLDYVNAQKATSLIDGFLKSGDWVAFNGKQAAGNYITALTGDAVASGPGSATITFSNVNAGVGSFGSATTTPVVTVNAKGLITAASSSTVTPAVGSITGLGTGVGTALAINVGTAGAPVVNGGALGTPSSGVATNLTGTAAALNIGGNAATATLAATVTTNANLTGPITSVGNATTIADAELAAIAGLTSVADKVPQFTGSGTAQLVDLKIGAEAAYTGTITWTAGAAPSGTANLRQFYTHVGNHVTWQISLTYATTGTTITNISLTFPTEFPTPAIPAGFTGASVKIWPCPQMRAISTPSGSIVASGGYGIYRNSADTGFEISGVAFSSGSYRTFQFFGTYFTA